MSRKLQYILTLIPRWWHRKGFGVQSPHDYELVRDVLFEPWAYYAYEDKGLHTPSSQQLWRILNHYRHADVCYVRATDDAPRAYARIINKVEAQPDASASTIFVVDGILDTHSALWRRILRDPHARVTFDMGMRGLVLFDCKRIKQSYLL